MLYSLRRRAMTGREGPTGPLLTYGPCVCVFKAPRTQPRSSGRLSPHAGHVQVSRVRMGRAHEYDYFHIFVYHRTASLLPRVPVPSIARARRRSLSHMALPDFLQLYSIPLHKTKIVHAGRSRKPRAARWLSNGRQQFATVASCTQLYERVGSSLYVQKIYSSPTVARRCGPCALGTVYDTVWMY